MREEINSDISKILGDYGGDQKSMIPLLQAIQDKFNYLPRKVLQEVCDQTEISPAQIMGVASFYSQFRLQPTGKHIIKVCTGTACHVKRSELVHDAFIRELKLEAGQETDREGKFTLEKVNCLGCCTLAPVIQIEELTYAHVDVETVDSILASFEQQLHYSKKIASEQSMQKEYQGEIRITLDSCCVASGTEEVRNAIQSAVTENELNVRIKRVGCVSMCHEVPIVEIIPNGKNSALYSKVQPEDIKQIIHHHFKPQGFWKRFRSSLYNIAGDFQTDQHWEGVNLYPLNVREKYVSSFLSKQIAISTEFLGALDPLDIEEYKEHHGFRALEHALDKFAPEQIIEKLKRSGLRGRGGAGFPTGKKWEMFSAQKNNTKYIICNGDEGDPGAFMDRMLLESYPYRIIEGMIIAAHATQATKGYFYIRAEYPFAVKRVQEALNICYELGYLGENILNSGLSFNIEIFRGAGAFICGEETALIASIEGKRGFPSSRPPYPIEKGLWGKPTMVNNVETFSQIPFIIRNELEMYTKYGTSDSKGTKVFALAGKIRKGGLIEVPMGITIREIVEDIGGGVAEGRKLKAVQIGGPSGGCVPYWLVDTPIDYHSLEKVGAMMGSGGLVVLDDTDCMVDIAKYFLSFTQIESCGKCTFCRVGTRRMLDILNSISGGKGSLKDLDELEKLASWTSKGSLCGLGQTAPNPVLSTLNYFREEYEAHIHGKCPAGKCQDLITYTIDENCIGCTKCAQYCPTDAIAFTPFEVHNIDQELCIKCDSCKQVCPEDAVLVN